MRIASVQMEKDCHVKDVGSANGVNYCHRPAKAVEIIDLMLGNVLKSASLAVRYLASKTLGYLSRSQNLQLLLWHLLHPSAFLLLEPRY